MRLSHVRLAERIIRAADPAHPADIVMRQEFKSRRDLEPHDMTEASRLVFGYYRWRGWLDENQPLESQIRLAVELAERFSREPRSFADSELVERVVPSWVRCEMEVGADWARSLQPEPRLWLRARSGQGKMVAERLGNCRVFGEGVLADTLEYDGRNDLFLTSEFHSGEFEIQDLHSQAVGFICEPKPGETWWDACAGEGGKTLHLSALMGNKGLIWASDRATWRLNRLRRRAARAKAFNYRVAYWDGGPNLPTKTRFDGVLVDAPCSGVGTWQRNPHTRWTTTPQDVQELKAIQLALLRHSSKAVKPGEKLLYAVCSLTHAETEAVAQEFNGDSTAFAPLAFTTPLTPKMPAASKVYLRPQDSGGNGMFVATWTRVA